MLRTVKDSGAHIFYSFSDEEKYIHNALTYLTVAIEQGNHIMLIENDRLMPLIEKSFPSTFGKEHIERIHKMNNYDFYCYRRNFNKDTVLSYLKEMIAPYLENNIQILTWAHVEWRDQEDIFRTIGKYEKEVENLLRQTNLINICSYDSNRIPDSLMEALMDSHDYFMTDDSLKKI